MPRPPRSFSSHPAAHYKEPKLVRMGRYALSAGLVCLVMVILYVVAWFGTSMFLRGSIQDWFEARRAEGYVATYDDEKARIDGFPFRVRATLSGVSFAPPKENDGTRPWLWSTNDLKFSVIPLPWLMGTLHVDLSAKQSFKKAKKTYEGRAKQFDLAVNWTAKGIPDHLDLNIKKLLLTDKKTSREVKIFDLKISTQRGPEDEYDFEVLGEGIKIPFGVRGMGSNVEEIILRGQLSEKFGQNGLDKEEIAQWRDAGGTLELTRMQFGYGPLIVQGNGTMALDGDLQLVGAFSARIQGFFQTVDRLRNAGVVRGPDASMAKVVLGMLSKQPKNGGRATISLPLTLQEGGFFAGPVRLANLPKIDW